MTAHAPTVAFSGIDCLDIDVQVQIANGLPAFTIVGLPDKAVGESRERVRAAFNLSDGGDPMIEKFLGRVDAQLYPRPGGVFYSGRCAFARASDLYILGLNPGGSPDPQTSATVERHITKVLHDVPNCWSEYTDESWEGRVPGTYGMQPRITHMLNKLGLNPHLVPASNVVFVRSNNEAALTAEKQNLLQLCWPVHEMVIQQLGVRAILCLGGTAGRWVREMLAADQPLGHFVETNARGWRSKAHANARGQCVLTLTHPSRADWRNPTADPTPFVQEILSLARAKH